LQLLSLVDEGRIAKFTAFKTFPASESSSLFETSTTSQLSVKMQNAVQDMDLATVPAPSSFYEPFEFHAAPGLSQEEYEAKVRGGW